MRDLGILLKVLTALYLVSAMLLLGLDLGRLAKPIAAEKRQRRLALLRGLILQLVVLPVVTVGVTRLFDPSSSEITVALLFLMAAPGGGVAPMLVQLGQGDVELAVELSLYLAKFTVFTAPLTVEWLGGFTSVHIHELPFILKLLLLQLVPLLFGKWVRRHHGPLADRLVRPGRWLLIGTGAATVVALLIDGRGRNIHALLAAGGWVSVVVVAVAAIVIARVFAGRNEAMRRAFTIGANGREVAVAIVMAASAFPDDRLMRAAVLTIWVLLLIVSALVAWVMRGAQKRKGERRVAPTLSARAAV